MLHGISDACVGPDGLRDRSTKLLERSEGHAIHSVEVGMGCTRTRLIQKCFNACMPMGKVMAALERR